MYRNAFPVPEIDVQRRPASTTYMLALLNVMAAAAAPRLVVISGCGSRGVGFGVAQQILAQDASAEVVVMARSEQRAKSVAEELGDRAHAVACDVTDDASCAAAAETIRNLGGSDLLSLVNNAGFAADLPWFPTPWPATAASETLAVNLYGAERLTRALLPMLRSAADGRVVFVSSGGGRLNMKRMSEAKRQVLLATEVLDWKGIVSMAEAFTAEYEAAAAAQTEEAPLPFMSPSGWWLQSYGFSKACLAAFSQVLSREEPSILSVTCSPGWVATEMSSTYTGDADMRTPYEGGEVPAWLAVGNRAEIGAMGPGFFMPDKSCVGWVAD